MRQLKPRDRWDSVLEYTFTTLFVAIFVLFAWGVIVGYIGNLPWYWDIEIAK